MTQPSRNGLASKHASKALVIDGYLSVNDNVWNAFREDCRVFKA